jgi:HAMP domain-containing protein
MEQTTTAPVTASGVDVEKLYAFVMALRAGDFSARLPIEGDWRCQEIAIHLNRFMNDMKRMTGEVQRVATELAEGTLGPQAEPVVPPGPWKEMVEAVNALAGVMTNQIRDMNRSAKLMVEGDPSRPITAPCKGETAELKDRLNVVRERMKGAVA